MCVGGAPGVFTAREVDFLFSNFLCLFVYSFAYSSLNPVRDPDMK